MTKTNAPDEFAKVWAKRGTAIKEAEQQAAKAAAELAEVWPETQRPRDVAWWTA